MQFQIYDMHPDDIARLITEDPDVINEIASIASDESESDPDDPVKAKTYAAGSYELKHTLESMYEQVNLILHSYKFIPKNIIVHLNAVARAIDDTIQRIEDIDDLPPLNDEGEEIL